MKGFAVCTIGTQTYFGNEMEYIAARSNKGDRVIFKGETDTVEFTWFYDAPVINLVSGNMIHSCLGDIFSVVA